MGRQLFLHHYLPAHLASALVTGALIEFVFNVEPINIPELMESGTAASAGGKKKEKGSVSGGAPTGSAQSRGGRRRLGSQSLLATWAAAGVVMICVIGGWYFFLPLTYGKPGLSVEEVNARKWLGYDLHFAK
jgi:dolichyl-phosphate-mannose-protein mannosyltransferase